MLASLCDGLYHANCPLRRSVAILACLSQRICARCSRKTKVCYQARVVKAQRILHPAPAEQNAFEHLLLKRSQPERQLYANLSVAGMSAFQSVKKLLQTVLVQLSLQPELNHDTDRFPIKALPDPTSG